MLPTAPLEAVIFDLDGTLVDSVPLCLSIINAMLEERGSARRIAYAEALPFASLGGFALITGLLGAECTDGEADLAVFRARYAVTVTPPESVYRGAGDMLADLRQAGLKLAVCSNKPQILCEKVLADLGLAQHFSVVVGSTAHLPAKPAPDMLDQVLRQLCLAPRQCLLVGDSEVDVALAATRGMDCLFVEHGYGDAGAAFPAADRFADCAGLGPAITSRLAASRESGNGAKSDGPFAAMQE